MKKIVLFASLFLICCSALAGANKYFRIKIDGFEYVRGMDTDEVWPLTRRTYAYIPVSAAQYGDGSKASWDAIPAIEQAALLAPVKDKEADIERMSCQMKAVIKAMIKLVNNKTRVGTKITEQDAIDAIKAAL